MKFYPYLLRLWFCLHLFWNVLSAEESVPNQFLPPPVPIPESLLPQQELDRASAGARKGYPMPFLASDQEGFPKQALVPDPNGVVWIYRGRKQEGGVPNPFDVRLDVERASVETTLKFSGVAHGIATTATLNGKAYLQGDRVAGFNIAGIARSSMLLEKDGAYIVLPRGLEIKIKETF